jgi:single-strand DNA-binding protein
MSRTLNKVMLIGNVGQAPEMNHTPSGIPVTSFRMATSEIWHDRDGKLREHTDWHTVIAWHGLAEVIQKIVKKGCRIYIEGKIQTRNFVDKSGFRKYIVEIVAESMLMLDNKKIRYDDFLDDNDNGYSNSTDITDINYSDNAFRKNYQNSNNDDLKFLSKY